MGAAFGDDVSQGWSGRLTLWEEEHIMTAQSASRYAEVLAVLQSKFRPNRDLVVAGLPNIGCVAVSRHGGDLDGWRDLVVRVCTETVGVYGGTLRLTYADEVVVYC